MDEKRLESFIFAGELKDGEIATYDYTSANAEGCVYLLLIGEEYYIGSTAATVHDRVRKHLFDMMTGRHPNEKIQTAYNRVGWCKAYIILRTAYKGYRLMEKMLIVLMQPPLNIGEKEANSKKMREVRETIWSTSHIERAFDGTASFANMSIDRIEKEVATLRELVTRSQAQKAKDMAEYRKNS